MKPTHNLITRRSLAATAALNFRWFASIIAGSTVLNSTLLAADWDGETSSDWNDVTNWVGNIGTGGTNAVINTTTPNIATISADIVAVPIDIIVGTGVGSNGQVNHTAGVAQTGGGNWLYVGTNGGTGVYNLADTSTSGGGITGFGQGSGTVNSGNQGHVASFGAAGSTGTLNIHTTGAANFPGALTVARGAGSVGVVNLESGTLATGGFTRFGFNTENLGGGTGTLNMTGGTLNKTGGDHLVFGDGPDATGVGNISGGEVNVNNEIWVGQNGSEGTLNISGGQVTNNSWVAIARAGGTGHVNMSGGTWIKGGDGNFIVGASGPGTMDHSGGLVDVQTGITWISEINGSSGTLTISDDAEFRTTVFSLAVQDNTTAVLNLDGGNVLTNQFIGGGGNATVNFNGSQIVASADNANFIDNLDNALIGSGGMLVDSNDFNLNTNQPIGGSGGVIKSGQGTLGLLGANTYSGATQINGGSLNLSTAATLTGPVTVAEGAGFGVVQAEEDGVLDIPNLTLGDDSNLSVTAFSAPGISSDPLIHITSTLTVNGNVTVNLTDEDPSVGLFPVLSYDTLAGSGGFVPGSLTDGVALNSETPIVTADGVVSLNIARVNRPYWTGSVNLVWDTTTANWRNGFNNQDTVYTDGDPVLFEDIDNIDFETKDVVLNTTVTPGGSGVTVWNGFDPYTITGSGSISGSGGLTKRGAAGLVLGTTNNFTGPAVLEQGIVTVNALADLGSPSPLGAGELILAGGTLDYTGPAVSVDRGFTIRAAANGIASTLLLDNDVTMSGPVTAELGKLALIGSGVLTLTHDGPISLANGPGDAEPASLFVDNGGLTLAGENQTVNVVGNTQIGVSSESETVFTVGGDTELTIGRFLVGFGIDSTPTVIVEENASVNKIGGSWLSIGNSENSAATMIVRGNGRFDAGGGDFNVSDVGTSKGTLIIEDDGVVSSDGIVFIGKNTGTEGILNMNGGSFEANSWMSIGRRTDSDGVVNVNGGTINQTGETQAIIVGENGRGTLNVNSGEVNVNGVGLFLTAETVGTGNGTVNLNGGTITARRVAERDFAEGNVSNFHFNGGLLVAGENSNPNYMDNLDNAWVEAGGANIDTNGQDITIAQALLQGSEAGGGLTKSGDGALFLNGENTFTGTTTVTEGALGGTGSLAGSLLVESGASIAPGVGVGTFTSGAATITGTYLCDIEGGSSDLLVVNGALDISGATLDINLTGEPASAAYVIATYTSLTGTFAQTLDLPAGYTVDYNYQGGNQIALTGTPSTSAYDTWAAGFGLDPQTDGAPDFDADNSGQSNLLEFALGGNPTDGSDNARIHHLVADTDASGQDELVITIAVLEGTPAFAGSPSPSATHAGVVYTIGGSLDLAEFPETVLPVTPAVTNGLPPAPEGYEYRSFRLEGSDGLPSQGFLRAEVSEAGPE